VSLGPTKRLKKGAGKVEVTTILCNMPWVQKPLSGGHSAGESVLRTNGVGCDKKATRHHRKGNKEEARIFGERLIKGRWGERKEIDPGTKRALRAGGKGVGKN